MKKGTKKCKECGRYNSPLIQSYYRGKKGNVSYIKRRKNPLYVSRKRCAFCEALLNQELKENEMETNR